MTPASLNHNTELLDSAHVPKRWPSATSLNRGGKLYEDEAIREVAGVTNLPLTNLAGGVAAQAGLPCCKIIPSMRLCTCFFPPMHLCTRVCVCVRASKLMHVRECGGSHISRSGGDSLAFSHAPVSCSTHPGRPRISQWSSHLAYSPSLGLPLFCIFPTVPHSSATSAFGLLGQESSPPAAWNNKPTLVTVRACVFLCASFKVHA